MFRNVLRRVRAAIGQEPYLGFNALGDIYFAGQAPAALPGGTDASIAPPYRVASKGSPIGWQAPSPNRMGKLYA